MVSWSHCLLNQNVRYLGGAGRAVARTGADIPLEKNTTCWPG